jgi:D-alanine transaminase
VLNDRLITHPVGAKVLPGITRQIILQLAAAMKIPIVERPLGIDEIRHADELFISSTTRELAWVSTLDDLAIGQGRCGALTLRLHEAYQRRVYSSIQNAAA